MVRASEVGGGAEQIERPSTRSSRLIYSRSGTAVSGVDREESKMSLERIEYCTYCGSPNRLDSDGPVEQEWRCGKCKALNRPPETFRAKWAAGEFDNCDYYALTAPVERWNAMDSVELVSEPAPWLTGDTSTGVVLYDYTLYVYSDRELAQTRAELLGRVKVLKLKCLSCFLRELSWSVSFAGVILDELWPLECYACRETNYSAVSHVRLDLGLHVHQLSGCAGQSNLMWEQHHGYDDPSLQVEWCRPVPVPGMLMMMDHRPQGGPMDLEWLIDPETLSFYYIFGHPFVGHKQKALGGTELDRLFARPTGSLAFARTMGESVFITRGEGVWIPIARRYGEEWSVFPWARGYELFAQQYFAPSECVEAAHLRRGPEFHINRTLAALETGLQGDVGVRDGDKLVSLCRDLISKARASAPGHFHAAYIEKALDKWDTDELPALVSADKICWHASRQDFDSAHEAYEEAMEIRTDCTLAMQHLASVYLTQGDLDAAEETLDDCLQIEPTNSRALFDRAVVAMHRGDEDEEMEFYRKAADADLDYAEPLYNMGCTYENNGDIDQAIACYEEALSRDPAHVKSLENLAIKYFVLGVHAVASECMWKALKADHCRERSYQVFLEMAKSMGDRDLEALIRETLEYNLPRSSLSNSAS